MGAAVHSGVAVVGTALEASPVVVLAAEAFQVAVVGVVEAGDKIGTVELKKGPLSPFFYLPT